jgi:hypothetical protein
VRRIARWTWRISLAASVRDHTASSCRRTAHDWLKLLIAHPAKLEPQLRQEVTELEGATEDHEAGRGEGPRLGVLLYIRTKRRRAGSRFPRLRPVMHRPADRHQALEQLGVDSCRHSSISTTRSRNRSAWAHNSADAAAQSRRSRRTSSWVQVGAWADCAGAASTVRPSASRGRLQLRQVRRDLSSRSASSLRSRSSRISSVRASNFAARRSSSAMRPRSSATRCSRNLLEPATNSALRRRQANPEPLGHRREA